MDLYVQPSGNLLEMLIVLTEKVCCQEIILKYHLGARAIKGLGAIVSRVPFHLKFYSYHTSTHYGKRQSINRTSASGPPKMA
jgi:hypothetical protein